MGGREKDAEAPSFLPPQTLTWGKEKKETNILGAMVAPRKNGNRGLVFCLAKNPTWQTSVFSALSQIVFFLFKRYHIVYRMPSQFMVLSQSKKRKETLNLAPIRVPRQQLTEASGDCAAVIKLRLASAAAGHEAGEEEEGEMTFSKTTGGGRRGRKRIIVEGG